MAPPRRLTNEQAEAVLRIYNQRFPGGRTKPTHQELADLLGVTRKTIHQITQGISYKEIYRNHVT